MKAEELHEYWIGVEIGRDANGLPKAEPWKLFRIMKGDLPLLLHDKRSNTFHAINNENQLNVELEDIYANPHYDMYLYQSEI